MYVDFVALIACKSALTVLLLGRRAFASQRVPVCLPATLVDSSSFCFATCVCLCASDSVCALWLRPKIGTQAPKSTLGGSKIDLRSPWGAPGAPKSAQEPQERPRAPQERPKSAQERAKSGQERPQSGQ